mmetsp:Transcript_98661/g.274612  ORF Transcript_98661/g.274612 Transcript_98661/m.274612 type:complete len:201 (+) Transcript_98661:383-985(+)
MHASEGDCHPSRSTVWPVGGRGASATGGDGKTPAVPPDAEAGCDRGPGDSEDARACPDSAPARRSGVGPRPLPELRLDAWRPRPAAAGGGPRDRREDCGCACAGAGAQTAGGAMAVTLQAWRALSRQPHRNADRDSQIRSRDEWMNVMLPMPVLSWPQSSVRTKPKKSSIMPSYSSKPTSCEPVAPALYPPTRATAESLS